MPTIPPQPGAPCWIGLTTPDVAATNAFYTGLLGWTAGESAEQFGGYYMFFTPDGRPVAGVMPRPEGADWPIGWTVYLTVEDVGTTLAAARDAGATVTADAMAVGDTGTMAELRDPSGALIGLWQPGTFAGFEVQAEPGAPGWFELHTRDYPAAVSFYTSVFGWDAHPMSDTPQFRYTTLGEGDGARAGIMDDAVLPTASAGSGWMTYLAVEDVDVAAARVDELGGAVTSAPQNSPYGRLASVTDPTGATFNLIGPNAAA